MNIAVRICREACTCVSDALPEPGELLYHYTTAATAFEHILPDGKIRLNPYERMRDPLEAKHWPDLEAFWASDEQTQQAELVKPYIVYRAKASARLLSLTADSGDQEAGSFGRGWARASMWQLYGDDHRGVCLAFDRQRLLTELAAQLGDSARYYAKPVEYVRTLAPDSLPPERIDTDSPEGITTAIEEYLDRNVDQLLFRKLTDWSGEQEFRVVAVRHAEDDHQELATLDVPFGDSLRAVICGEKLPAWQYAGARVICKEATVLLKSDVVLRRCFWHNRQPTIVDDVPGFGQRS